MSGQGDGDDGEDSVFYDPYNETDYLYDQTVDDKLERDAMVKAGKWCVGCYRTLPVQQPQADFCDACKKELYENCD